MNKYIKSKRENIHVRRVKSCFTNTQGFTLVELVVVLIIIALLAGTIGPALIGYIDKAKENKALSNAKKVQVAVRSCVDEAHNAFVKPSDKVTKEKVSEMAQISFPEGAAPFTVTYKNNTWNSANPTNDMYTIDTLTYDEDGFRATYTRATGGWTVARISSGS